MLPTEFWLQVMQSVLPIVLASLALVAYWIRLRFLHKVFRHAGKRSDLKAAGKASRLSLLGLSEAFRGWLGR